MINTVTPRWEWRTFGNSFGEAEDRITKHTRKQFRESEEIYILSRRSDENIKIRNELLDIKTLRQINDHRLEQWYPVMKTGFPLGSSDLEVVFKAWKMPRSREEPTRLRRAAALSLSFFLNNIVSPHPDLQRVDVAKKRYGYVVQGCVVEIADLLLNDHPIRTVAVEMEDPDRVAATVRDLGLDEFENINYVRALKKFIKMERDS